LEVWQFVCQLRELFNLILGHSRLSKSRGCETGRGEHVVNMKLVPKVYERENQ
jgi:hypothetical protein